MVALPFSDVNRGSKMFRVTLDAGALDDREPDVDYRLWHRSTLCPIDDASRSEPADGRSIDADGGQGRASIRREVQVPVAHYGDAFRHRDAASLRFDHHAQREHV